MNRCRIDGNACVVLNNAEIEDFRNNIHAYTQDIHKYPVLFRRILGFSVGIVQGIPNQIHQEKEN